MFLPLLPLVFVLSALLALTCAPAPLARCWRQCALAGALLCGLLLFCATEALGAVRLLTPGFAAAFWLLACCGLGIVLFLRREGLAGKFALRGSKPLEPAEKWILACIVVIALFTLAQAIVSPPNNWDSMSYHLARVMHWRQNLSVDFYPTHIGRQLHRAPFAEYAILNIHLLWGGDRFVNLAQWAAMLGSLAAVSLLSARFGAGRKSQLASALFAATLPIGILESSTTQNDYVCAFFVLCFVWLLYGLKRETPLRNYLAAGAAFGLAALTKPTAYLFMAPFGLWFLLARLRGVGMLRNTFLGLCLAGALNAPHAARNVYLYGAPLGPGPGMEDLQVESNEALGVKTLFSNIIRQTSLDANLPSAKAGASLEAMVRAVHRLFGIDPDSPKTTVAAAGGFRIPAFAAFEDTAPNPLHLLVIASIFLWPGFWRRGGLPALHAALALCGFVIFCFFIKWSPWSTRHHLVLFLLLAPALAAALRGTGMLRVLLPVLALASYYWLLFNVRKPIAAEHNMFNIPRAEQYFLGRPGNTGSYLAIAAAVEKSGCRDIGLVLGPDSWEYPFWLLLNSDGSRRLEHVEVGNPSAVLGRDDFSPCFTVRANRAAP